MIAMALTLLCSCAEEPKPVVAPYDVLIEVKYQLGGCDTITVKYPCKVDPYLREGDLNYYPTDAILDRTTLASGVRSFRVITEGEQQ